MVGSDTQQQQHTKKGFQKDFARQPGYRGGDGYGDPIQSDVQQQQKQQQNLGLEMKTFPSQPNYHQHFKKAHSWDGLLGQNLGKRHGYPHQQQPPSHQQFAEPNFEPQQPNFQRSMYQQQSHPQLSLDVGQPLPENYNQQVESNTFSFHSRFSDLFSPSQPSMGQPSGPPGRPRLKKSFSDANINNHFAPPTQQQHIYYQQPFMVPRQTNNHHFQQSRYGHHFSNSWDEQDALAHQLQTQMTFKNHGFQEQQMYSEPLVQEPPLFQHRQHRTGGSERGFQKHPPFGRQSYSSPNLRNFSRVQHYGNSSGRGFRPPHLRSVGNNTRQTSSPSSPSGSPKARKQVQFNSVSEVKGRIYSLSKDQYGCRFLQKKLEEGDVKDTQMIYEESFPNIVELMTDPFGNYLCQKLVEHCNQEQKTNIIKSISGDLVNISKNMHGTRAVQKVIESLATPGQVKLIVRSLRNNVVPLIKDLNGNHVIQRCLQKLGTKEKQFIYDAVAGRCVEVATHKHGCCVLQRCIDYASKEQKVLLNREIIHNALPLVQNPFGNYVVQYTLDLGESEINNQIMTRFLGSLYVLSTNKFSSNVIEKCLRIANSRIRHSLVDEVIKMPELPKVLQDNYGNYVIQTALSVCEASQFDEFSQVIKPLLPNLIRSTPYGKKIESKILKREGQQLGNKRQHNF